MFLSLSKASKEASIAKSTLSEAINSGRLSADKDERGRYKIDPAELFRVFPKTTPNEQPEPQPNIEPNTENRLIIERLQAELEAEKRITANMEETVADLRERLDKENADNYQGKYVRPVKTKPFTRQSESSQSGLNFEIVDLDKDNNDASNNKAISEDDTSLSRTGNSNGLRLKIDKKLADLFGITGL